MQISQGGAETRLTSKLESSVTTSTTIRTSYASSFESKGTEWKTTKTQNIRLSSSQHQLMRAKRSKAQWQQFSQEFGWKIISTIWTMNQNAPWRRMCISSSATARSPISTFRQPQWKCDCASLSNLLGPSKEQEIRSKPCTHSAWRSLFASKSDQRAKV